MNPAGLFTRPLPLTGLHEWIKGHVLLLKNQEDWPCCEPHYERVCITKEYTPESLQRANCVTVEETENIETGLINRPSDWKRRTRMIAYCRRFLIQNHQKSLKPGARFLKILNPKQNSMLTVRLRTVVSFFKKRTPEELQEVFGFHKLELVNYQQ